MTHIQDWWDLIRLVKRYIRYKVVWIGKLRGRSDRNGWKMCTLSNTKESSNNEMFKISIVEMHMKD